MGTDNRVLIVDDDALIRLTISEVLKDENIEVAEADGAGQCIEILERGFQGVVLMDIMMPDKDGWDTIREILDRDLYRGIIIIMLTAKDVPAKPGQHNPHKPSRGVSGQGLHGHVHRGTAAVDLLVLAQ